MNIWMSYIWSVDWRLESGNKAVQFRWADSLGSLSNNDYDGSENVTEKMNVRPFKLYRVYLEPSNVGDFSWSWIFKGFIHVR